jgi:metal-responsive CopG/Arc/MetJ family transcriptional regulator
MTRNRASIAGGYVRKTVCIPSTLLERIEAIREEEPGLSLSAFMTKAAELLVSRQEKKTKRTR